jgi:hypothetical protein
MAEVRIRASIRDFTVSLRVTQNPTDKDGIKRTDFGGFGGCKNASVNAAQDDDRCHQRPLAVPDCNHQFLGSKFFTGPFKIILFGNDESREHKGTCEHKPGNESGHEKSGDGSIGNHPVNDQGVARGNKNSEGSSGGGDTGRETFGIVHLNHGRYHQAPDGSRCRRAGPAERRKYHAGQNGHKGQAAGKISDHFAGNVNDAFGDSGRFH